MDPHLAKSGSIKTMFQSVWSNKNLIYQLAKREVIGRYRGSVVGLAWSFFNPLLMLTIYTFVFSVVFQARWGEDANASRPAFAIILFVGVLMHGIFAECINRAPMLILSNVSYVKRVVFPLEILPWVAMASALFHAFVTLLVLLAAEVLIMGALPWTAMLFPLVAAPLVLTTMGTAWLLAAFGVFVRDIGQITVVLTTAVLFLSPVFYPISALPERYRFLFLINPLTFIIEQSRDVLIWGRVPNWSALAIYTVVGLFVAWCGFWSFQKMRRGFADVL